MLLLSGLDNFIQKKNVSLALTWLPYLPLGWSPSGIFFHPLSKFKVNPSTVTTFSVCSWFYFSLIKVLLTRSFSCPSQRTDAPCPLSPVGFCHSEHHTTLSGRMHECGRPERNLMGKPSFIHSGK